MLCLIIKVIGLNITIQPLSRYSILITNLKANLIVPKAKD